MKKTVKILSIIILIGTIVDTMPLTSLAATSHAAISSVSIRVGTDCEVGDYLPSRLTAVEGTTDVQNGTHATVNPNKYTIDDVDWASGTNEDRALTVGSEPKMVATLRGSYYNVGDRDYISQGGYSSSNVTARGGTFVPARIRESGDALEVTAKPKGVSGDFPVPALTNWTGSGFGNARWGYYDEDDRKASSGYYNVSPYRGSGPVRKLEVYQGTSYNFYPYITKEGSYSPKVWVVLGTEVRKKYDSKSDWVQSDEVYVDKEHVFDGIGQSNASGNSGGQVGWIQNGSTWFYRYLGGTYQKNSWAKINDKWYLFDNDGRMLIGWQLENSRYYYMDNSGAMMVGWIRSGDKWYYLNSNPGDLEGSMCMGWAQVNGLIYHMNSSRAMVEDWQETESDWYYFYLGSGNKTVNTTINGFRVDGNGIWKK